MAQRSRPYLKRAFKKGGTSGSITADKDKLSLATLFFSACDCPRCTLVKETEVERCELHADASAPSFRILGEAHRCFCLSSGRYPSSGQIH
jgi:hypothetical protein